MRLKLSGFANALAPVICLAAWVLHGNYGAEVRRQRPESIEEVAHGTDRRLTNGLESTPRFPFRAEHQGGCVHAAHVCPRCRWWLRFAADRRTFGAVPRISRSHVLTVPPCYDDSFQILARGNLVCGGSVAYLSWANTFSGTLDFAIFESNSSDRSSEFF